MNVKNGTITSDDEQLNCAIISKIQKTFQDFEQENNVLKKEIILLKRIIAQEHPVLNPEEKEMLNSIIEDRKGILEHPSS